MLASLALAAEKDPCKGEENREWLNEISAAMHQALGIHGRLFVSRM